MKKKLPKYILKNPCLGCRHGENNYFDKVHNIICWLGCDIVTKRASYERYKKGV